MIKIPEHMWADDIKKAKEINELREEIEEIMMKQEEIEEEETPYSVINLIISRMSLPVEIITKVKFQYSERTEKITTIVWFADGDKRTATPADGDIFNKRTGIEQCILKKVFGNGSRLKKIYKEWC